MPKFLNIAHGTDALPSLVNVDHIVRVRPGSCENHATGREDQCCIFFAANEDVEYEHGSRMRELYAVDVHLPVSEIVRRMRTELLSI